MWRLLSSVLLVGCGLGAWYACQHFDVSLSAQASQWLSLVTRPVPDVYDDPGLPPPSQRDVIRVATWNLGRCDELKLANPRCREVLAQTIARFDLVALQGLQGANQGVLVHLLEQVNALQRDYDFAVSTTLGLRGAENYCAFVFDRTSVEIDRTVLYQIEDSGGRLHRRPLVGSFRARGVPANQAFTFTIISMQIAADDLVEADMLEPLYRAVRERRPGEDDILLAGTVMCDEARMARLEQIFGLAPLVTGVPTTTRGTQLADNLLVVRKATTELTGRVGVVDLIREYGLAPGEAQEISEHIPVWAEFNVYEGGLPGNVHSPLARGPR